MNWVYEFSAILHALAFLDLSIHIVFFRVTTNQSAYTTLTDIHISSVKALTHINISSFKAQTHIHKSQIKAFTYIHKSALTALTD